jgi:hypothetical protein
MAMTDYPATATAAPMDGLGGLLSRLVPMLRRKAVVAETAPTTAKVRPSHEANYLADIGMEVGF